MQIHALCNSAGCNVLCRYCTKTLLMRKRGLSRFNPAFKKQLIMQIKLTGILLMGAFLHASAGTVAQNITLKVKDAPLQEVLLAVKKQTGYSFFFNGELLTSAKPVTLNVKNATLGEVLSITFSNQPLNYVIENKTIFLSRKTSLQPDGLAEQKPPSDTSILPVVTGRVTDPSGAPVAGATIWVKGSHSVISADQAGGFRLANVRSDDTLIITSVNFIARHVAINASTSLRISLQLSVTKLQEVTVYNTGYQTISKERATGSFGKPDMEVFNKRTSTMDVMSRLEGQVPGMFLAIGDRNTTASQNGNGVTTRKSLIRGISSVQLFPSQSDPLYVVNGVILPDFSSVNPDDIEDITVLKDAAAAAIWGAKAANGVVVVTTKSGTRSARLSISYSGFVNYRGRPDLTYGKPMNSREYIQAAKETFDPTDFPWGSLAFGTIAPHDQIMYDQYRGLISAAVANQKLDSLASINNIPQIEDLLYRPAITNNHAISVSGGNSVYSFYGSLGYTGTQSNTPGEVNNAYKINFTQSITPGNRLKLTLNTSIINTVTSRKNVPSVNGSFLPYQLFRDANGNDLNINYLEGYSDSLRQNYQARSRINLDYNPLNEINSAYNKSNNLSVNVTANIGLKLWKGLSFNGTYGYLRAPGASVSYTDGSALSYRKQIVGLTVAPTITSTPVYNLPPGGGAYTTSNNLQRSFTVRNQLVYDDVLRKGRDHLTVQFGNDIQESFSSSNSASVVGYNEMLGTYALLDYARLRNGIGGTVTGFGSLAINPFSVNTSYSRFISYFGLAGYSFNSKYNLDLSWRQDYSNQFGKNLATQNKPVWSIGGKWQMARENFMKPVKWVSDLNLRVTHGITGNSPYIGAASIQDILGVVSASTSINPVLAGNALTLANPANAALSWEKTHTTNIGLDFAVLNRRLGGSIDLYQKNTTDLIGAVQLNPFTGSASTTGNIGKLINKGVEISLRSENIRTRVFNWTSTLVFSYNNNKLVDYSQSNSVITGAVPPILGYNIRSLWAYRYAGLDNMGDPQVYLADKTITKSPFVTVGKDQVYMGTTQPPISGGLSNTFGYKGFSLALNMVYNMGAVMRRDLNTLYTGRMAFSTNFSGLNYPEYFLNRWKQPGDEAFTNIPAYQPNRTINQRRNINYYTQGDVNVVSASYIRLRDVTLTYDLQPAVLKRLRLQRAGVFIQTSNYLLWTANHFGIDPEYTRSVSSTRDGHSYSLGLNLSF